MTSAGSPHPASAAVAATKDSPTTPILRISASCHPRAPRDARRARQEPGRRRPSARDPERRPREGATDERQRRGTRPERLGQGAAGEVTAGRQRGPGARAGARSEGGQGGGAHQDASRLVEGKGVQRAGHGGGLADGAPSAQERKG